MRTKRSNDESINKSNSYASLFDTLTLPVKNWYPPGTEVSGFAAKVKLVYKNILVNLGKVIEN
jgi:hypothetical protein